MVIKLSNNYHWIYLTYKIFQFSSILEKKISVFANFFTWLDQMFWQIYQKLMLSGFLRSGKFMPDPLFEIFLTSRDLNGLCQKGCHILVKNWIFDDPFHKKLPVLVILVPVMIWLLGSGSFLEKLGFRGCWGQ